MGFYDTITLRTDLPDTFENDGYILDEEMNKKYSRSRIKIRNGQVRDGREFFWKNLSVFDVRGMKLAWGDIAPRDVDEMFGAYYLLSEYKSFWSPDDEFVKGWGQRSVDPNSLSQFNGWMPDFEPVVFDIIYVKRNALARILDGQIQSSEDLIRRNLQ